MFRQISTLFVIVAVCMVGCTSYDVDTPDTPANRKGFEQHLKIKPTETVSQIYYYADEMGADVSYQLSFKCDKKTIDQIVTKLSLIQATADHTRVNPRDDLKWWKPDSTKGRNLWVKEKKNEYYWRLWYSEQDNIALYYECSV